ncbi:MAG TPA: YtxH domain-containing protein [Syntrophales bacterium]|nr:YtxH domain-containing protein [Syntrophales bacterium]HOX93603.1 YtxH domain-containing protein [Syntrophales bacterium]HPI56898.1 YtxH domain-containing protein [Syntrophales bacterium]HPN23484.1 YtxH domain-containing protein [Syntrophales bacterium]HQM27991.1 YtxH domain-containing protein [Syntrophales bacterium]
MNEERRGFTKGFLVGTLAGGLIGALLVILYAPGRGEETREEIAARTRNIADRFRSECLKALDKRRASYESRIDRLSEQGSGIIGKIERLLKKAGG